MKKIILCLVATTAGLVAYSQTTKALISQVGNQASVGSFNPATGTYTEMQKLTLIGNASRDFIYDAKNGNAIFQVANNGLQFLKIDGNEVTSNKVISMMNNVVAPAYMPANQKVVLFNIQKEFNGYGNNEDNLFLSTVDLKKGTTQNLLKFTDISFDNVVAPYYGKVLTMDRFTGQNVNKDVAISKPLYIAEKDIYMVMIKDVTGTNRLYKVKMNGPKPTYSSARCNYNIVDMAYFPMKDIIKTLFFETVNGVNILKVGDMDINTNAISNVQIIRTFASSGNLIIDNGSIKFNADFSQLYTSYFSNNKTEIKSIDMASNVPSADAINYTGYVQFDFGYTESSYKPLTYENIYKVYPNPTSTGEFTFRNQSGIIPNAIYIYDQVGQLVKSIKVEEMVSEIKIDLSAHAQGVYYMKVDMPGEDFNTKVTVTH
jgi:hypothetical protein